MIKLLKRSETKKSSFVEETKPIPIFYRISQVMLSGQIQPLFPKPVFCTQAKGLQLGLSKHTFQNNLVTIEVKALDPAAQKIALLEATESDLTKYTKED